MPRILLLVPGLNGPGKNKRWNTDWDACLEESISSGMWDVMTPGVLLISSLCDKSKYEVEVIDEKFSGIPENLDYDIVAMYLVTPNARRGYMWARYFHSRGSHVVMGGVHALCCEEECAGYADTLILGEAEKTWPEFLRDFEAGKPKKRYAQQRGTIDVNSCPVPDFSMLPPNARKIIPVQTSRGCPHGCRFCNVKSLYGLRCRFKSPDIVKQELEQAFAVNRHAAIYFTDDNFMCNRKRSLQLFETLRAFKFRWYANTDISLGDDVNLIREAYGCGCRQVLIGFESLCRGNLNKIDVDHFKSGHISQYEYLINRIQSGGIGVVGSFIVGMDMDDSSIFDRIFEFVQKTGLYGASVTVCTPYPGTPLFETARAEGRIATYDWDKYTIFEPVIRPKRMSAEELRNGYIGLLKRIHSDESINSRIAGFKEKLKNLRRESNERQTVKM